MTMVLQTSYDFDFPTSDGNMHEVYEDEEETCTRMPYPSTQLHEY